MMGASLKGAPTFIPDGWSTKASNVLTQKISGLYIQTAHHSDEGRVPAKKKAAKKTKKK
jgi:hypothetical protein